MVGFQILPFLKLFVIDFSGTMKARKLKVHINMDFYVCGPTSMKLILMELCHVTLSYSEVHVSGKHEFKIFHNYGSFSSNSAAAGL